MAINIARVAAVAGVSTSTVSRVFAAPDVVKEETRERVLAVARRLGYSPNRIARSLAMGRTSTLGLIVPDIANPFFAEIVKAVQSRARRKDHAVFIADTDEHAGDERELALAMSKQVDGLLMVSPRASEADLEEIAGAIPMVMVNRRAAELPAVVAPSGDGMRRAVEHLAALGHRNLCYINASRSSWSNEQRELAVREACEFLGLKLTELGPFEPRFDAGVAAADMVRASGATAVIAHNDMIAIGVVSRLAQQGVLVPDDVSVVGVDDTVLARTYNPPLTSVRIPLTDMGTRAVDLLLSLISDSDPASGLVELDTSLIVRGSTSRKKE